MVIPQNVKKSQNHCTLVINMFYPFVDNTHVSLLIILILKYLVSLSRKDEIYITAVLMILVYLEICNDTSNRIRGMFVLTLLIVTMFFLAASSEYECEDAILRRQLK